jgi:hypothetical protein
MTGAATRRLAQVALKNNIQVFYMQTRLTVNGLLKGFLKTGDVRLTEINLLYLDK